jgi:hypothetical protein
MLRRLKSRLEAKRLRRFFSCYRLDKQLVHSFQAFLKKTIKKKQFKKMKKLRQTECGA